MRRLVIPAKAGIQSNFYALSENKKSIPKLVLECFPGATFFRKTTRSVSYLFAKKVRRHGGIRTAKT
jgi:hypothetical protein